MPAQGNSPRNDSHSHVQVTQVSEESYTALSAANKFCDSWGGSGLGSASLERAQPPQPAEEQGRRPRQTKEFAHAGSPLSANEAGFEKSLSKLPNLMIIIIITILNIISSTRQGFLTLSIEAVWADLVM